MTVVKYKMTLKIQQYHSKVKDSMSMIFDNSKVRRQDRLLDEQRAKEILKNTEYGVMAMTDENGEPYAVPLNYVWDGNNCLYIHCAPEGRKLKCIAKNNRVTMCITGKVELRPEMFTTAYESVLISGTAETADNDEERWHAIKLIIDKLSHGHAENGMTYSEKSFDRVTIVRIRMESMSGKCKNIFRQ